MLSLLMALGCFTPPIPDAKIEAIPFQNGLVRSTDAVLQPLTVEGLLCPDGEPATIFAVYRTGLTEAAPVVVVFHSGAFDYVLNPDPLHPLDREHFQLENRLTAEWSRTRVFETLGLVDTESGDAGEDSRGAMAAALADAGAFALYPANCWGDLWHNEYGYFRNDGSEGFDRNGRFLAWQSVGIASKDPVEAARFRTDLGLGDLAVPLNSEKVYLVGLGDGGRAPQELFWRAALGQGVNMPTISGTIIDSTPDHMDWYVAREGTYPDIVTGLDRIYTTDIGRLSYFSMHQWTAAKGFKNVMQNSLQVFYSSDDPAVPNETIESLVALKATYPEITATDTGNKRHVQLNTEYGKAREAVDLMLSK